MAARTAFQIEPTQIDLRAAEQAVAFLAALRIDLDRDGLAETPGRTARAYAELFYTQPFQMTTFPNDEGYDEGYDELVLARSVEWGGAAGGRAQLYEPVWGRSSRRACRDLGPAGYAAPRP